MAEQNGDAFKGFKNLPAEPDKQALLGFVLATEVEILLAQLLDLHDEKPFVSVAKLRRRHAALLAAWKRPGRRGGK